MMRTSNPALRPELFSPVSAFSSAASTTMTVRGTAVKTGVLLACCVATASFTWPLATTNPQLAGGLALAGILGGLIAAIITIFKPTAAPITGPLYAGLEGLALGAISALLEQRYPGIALQAVGLTFGVLALLVVVYASGMIRVTGAFRAGVMAATGAIFLVYLVSMLLGFIGVGVPYIHDSGPIGIGFSAFVVVIASLNLVLDFDFIDKGAARGLPKYMEWFGAFALMVTLVWLYLEILRLLAKLRDR